MPFCKAMIHLIWATKFREPSITKQLKPLLLEHIKQNALNKSIFITEMNCVEDHIHVLVSLSTDQSISQVVKLIKGESSFWINKIGILDKKFEWQEEYMALSVSESAIKTVRNYIKNQEEHHQDKSFDKEHKDFMKIHE